MKRFIIIIGFLAVLAGTFDACMDVRRDNVQDSIFLKIEAPWFQAWYQGGNEHYTLPVWGPYDFWHFSKSCLMGTWCLIAVFAFIAGIRIVPLEEWYHSVILFLSVYWVEGLTFALFYHIVWRL